MLSNTHFAIAVHALTGLAFNRGEWVGSEGLAKSVGTNPSFLRGVIGQLRDAGLVETRLGKGGGARLARPADEITLHDVHRAIEEGAPIATHVCDADSVCPVARGMGRLLDDVNDRVARAVRSELETVTVADLLAAHVRRVR